MISSCWAGNLETGSIYQGPIPTTGAPTRSTSRLRNALRPNISRANKASLILASDTDPRITYPRKVRISSQHENAAPTRQHTTKNRRAAPQHGNRSADDQPNRITGAGSSAKHSTACNLHQDPNPEDRLVAARPTVKSRQHEHAPDHDRAIKKNIDHC